MNRFSLAINIDSQECSAVDFIESNFDYIVRARFVDELERRGRTRTSKQGEEQELKTEKKGHSNNKF